MGKIGKMGAFPISSHLSYPSYLSHLALRE